MYSGKRVLVILNPSSGREAATTVASRVEDALRRHGAEHITMSVTKGPDDALSWASSAAESGFDLVLAGGGDGTVADVAHGILESDRELTIGIIPLGTGNGLARVLGIPIDPVAAVDEMARGKLTDLDVISVDSHDRTSLLFLGAGLDAEINRDADKSEKSRLGFLAYVKATLANVGGRRNHELRLTIDGKESVKQGHTVMMFNAARIDILGATFGPDADPHDGIADLAVLSSPGTLAVVLQVLRLLNRAASQPTLAPVRELVLDANPPLLVQIDGDVIGETPLHARLLPGALSFITTRNYRARDAARFKPRSGRNA